MFTNQFKTVNNKHKMQMGAAQSYIRLGPIGSAMRINTVLNYKAVVAEKCSMDSVRSMLYELNTNS